MIPFQSHGGGGDAMKEKGGKKQGLNVNGFAEPLTWGESTALGRDTI